MSAGEAILRGSLRTVPDGNLCRLLRDDEAFSEVRTEQALIREALSRIIERSETRQSPPQGALQQASEGQSTPALGSVSNPAGLSAFPADQEAFERLDARCSEGLSEQPESEAPHPVGGDAMPPNFPSSSDPCANGAKTAGGSKTDSNPFSPAAPGGGHIHASDASLQNSRGRDLTPVMP